MSAYDAVMSALVRSPPTAITTLLTGAASQTTFARASAGFARNAAGALTSFISGAPRITDRGLLIEAATTNLWVRSQELDNATNLKSSTSITANAYTAPDGTATADAVVETGGDGYCYQAFALGSGSYSFSSHVKADTLSWHKLSYFATGKSAWVNAGAIGTVEAGVTVRSEALTGGWYRDQLRLAAPAAVTAAGIMLAVGDSGVTYSGTASRRMGDWGRQLETGPSSRSYVPTTSSTASRAADSATVAVPAIPPGVVASWLPNGVNEGHGSPHTVFSLETDANNWIALIEQDGSLWLRVLLAGVVTADVNLGTVAAMTAYRCAVRLAPGDIAGSLNGAAVVVAAPASLPAINKANLGSIASTFQLDGYLNHLALLPNAPTNAQLQSLAA